MGNFYGHLAIFFWSHCMKSTSHLNAKLCFRLVRVCSLSNGFFAKSKSSKFKATFCSLGWSSLHKIATYVRLPDSGIAVQSLQGLVTKNPVFSAFIVFDKIFLLISHFIYKIDKFEQEIGTETKQLNSTNWSSWKHYKQIRDN